jgi:hypothetical protein
MLLPTVGVPDPFVAGATIRMTWPDIPVVPGRIVRLFLRGARTLDAVAAAESGRYVVTVAADSSRGLVAGRYRYQVWVIESTGEKALHQDGDTRVEKSFEYLRDGDALSHAERAYNAITAVIEGRITADVQSYQLNGRAVTMIPLGELVRLQQSYALEIRRSRGGNARDIVKVVLE